MGNTTECSTSFRTEIPTSDLSEGLCLVLEDVPDLPQEKANTLLGAKGAGLTKMHRLGISVPPAIILTTRNYEAFRTGPVQAWNRVQTSLREAFQKMEARSRQGFGNAQNPLLVSVRSGAKSSMPGMMDTVLNVGLNDETVVGLANVWENEGFAYETYARFIKSYAIIVLGVESSSLPPFPISSSQHSQTIWMAYIRDLNHHLQITRGELVPQDVWEQLACVTQAVFTSWMNPRASVYRGLHGISETEGTAVIIQTMIFGNLDTESGTLVAFTRNPSTGAKEIFGEYLPRAQGEDLVSGTHTPFCLSNGPHSLETALPILYKQLCQVAEKLETYYGDMQEIEATIQQNKLWILQTRTGKRTAQATLKIAVDLVREGKTSPETIIPTIDPNLFDKMLHDQLENVDLPLFTQGLSASPGAAVGRVVFEVLDCIAAHGKGLPTILVRSETSPEDIQGLALADGLITARGGMTSHAAVVARGMGIPCIVGAEDLRIQEKEGYMTAHALTVEAGEWLSLDATSGQIFVGKAPKVSQKVFPERLTILKWAQALKRLKVYANAETPDEIGTALEFQAEGVGLCRTEHMFFSPSALLGIRRFMVSDTQVQREEALEELFPLQREAFWPILRLLKGGPIVVRLLDPPLHEFLPNVEEEIRDLASVLNLSYAALKNKLEERRESNPMLGHRGCRLAITFPEIYDMQIQAIFSAAEQCYRENIPLDLRILIPFISSVEEFCHLKRRIQSLAEKVGFPLVYKIGTMIELPRAVLLSKELAQHADFFSFGTNDLTQTTFGLSRDDSQYFLKEYLQKGLWPEGDPFRHLDRVGVGKLIQMSCKDARLGNPDIVLGVCGEHAGDPRSIDFFEEIGLDYISCSPFRIPTARLAAAQAALSRKRPVSG